jgi:uncharacterized protein (UPF0218 family)
VQLFLSLVESLIQLKWPLLSEVAKFIESDPSVAVEVDGFEDLSDLVLTDLRVHLNHSFEELALGDLPGLVLVECTECVSQSKVLVHQALVDLQNGRNDIFRED